jgi:4'-phosphopantetheinyl transferase
MSLFWSLTEYLEDNKDLLTWAEWLTPVEAAYLVEKRIPKRRAEWLRARLAAKHLIEKVYCPGTSLNQIEIGRAESGAPYALVQDQRLPGCLSLSHREQWVLAGLTLQAGTKIGVDLEKVEKRAGVFAEDYFTLEELAAAQELPPEQYDGFVTAVWSAKEAVLKALEVGLSLDTRQVAVHLDWVLDSAGWRTFSAQASGQAWQGRWCWEGDYVVTMCAPDGMELERY